MKHYCHHCGKEVENGNKFCPYCGALQDRYSDDDRYDEREDEYAEAEVVGETKERNGKKRIINESTKRDLDLLIKVFMLIPTILVGFAIIPLIWMVPMTMAAWKRADSKEPYGLPLSICSIIFMGLPVAGILMIVRDVDTYGD